MYILGRDVLLSLSLPLGWFIHLSKGRKGYRWTAQLGILGAWVQG